MKKKEELTAEEVMAKLKKDIEQKKIKIEDAQKVEDAVCEKLDKVGNKYEKIPDFDDVALWSSIVGGASALAGYAISKFVRDGGNIKTIDNYKEFFVNHPEAFEYVKDITGSTNLDYISKFVAENDSVGAACGIKDFFLENMQAAGLDACAIGAAIIVFPTIAAFLANSYYGLKQEWLYEKFESARSKKYTLEKEYKSLKAKLEKMEKAEQQKAEVPKQEKVAEKTL